MNERILNLLSLCMQAMEEGYNVKFEVYKGITDKKGTDFWHYGKDNGELYIIKHLGTVDKAEEYLGELIENGKHKTNG